MFTLFKKFIEKPAFATLCMLIFGIIFLVFGAIIFSLTELENEDSSRKELLVLEKQFKSRYNFTNEDFTDLKEVILNLEQHRNGPQWGFSGALYFAITIVTTIGYGHSVPQTQMGKLFCILYTVIGVPLWFITFQLLADRFNLTVARGLKIVYRKFGATKGQVTKMHLRLFGLISCIITLLVGLVSFAYYENWSLLDSAYFCLMTLTSIGLGDYVALQANNALQQDIFYIIYSFVYILVGLTVFAATLNLLIVRPGSSSNSASSKNKRQEMEVSTDENSIEKPEFSSDAIQTTRLPTIGSKIIHSFKKAFCQFVNFVESCFSTQIQNVSKTQTYNVNATSEKQEQNPTSNYLYTEKHLDLPRILIEPSYTVPTHFEENSNKRNNIPSRYMNLPLSDDSCSDNLSEASYCTDSTSCSTPDMSRRTSKNHDLDDDVSDHECQIGFEEKTQNSAYQLTENKMNHLQVKLNHIKPRASYYVEDQEDIDTICVENETAKTPRLSRKLFSSFRKQLDRTCSHASSLKQTKKPYYQRFETGVLPSQNKSTNGAKEFKALPKRIQVLSHEIRPRAWSDSSYRGRQQGVKSPQTSFSGLSKDEIRMLRDRNRSTAEYIKNQVNGN